MPLGLFKKVGKYPGTGGLPPAGSRGSALVGVQGGRSPLEARVFLNQNCPESHQLTRMVVTHTIHAREEEEEKKGGGGESRNSDKSRKNGIPDYLTRFHYISFDYSSDIKFHIFSY